MIASAGTGLAPISIPSMTVLFPEPFGPTSTTRGVRPERLPSRIPRHPLISTDRITATVPLRQHDRETGTSCIFPGLLRKRKGETKGADRFLPVSSAPRGCTWKSGERRLRPLGGLFPLRQQLHKRRVRPDAGALLPEAGQG